MVIPLEIDDQAMEVEINNTVTEIVGKITSCFRNKINKYQSWLHCKQKVEPKQGNRFECGYCSLKGVLGVQSQKILAEAIMEDTNGGIVSITLYTEEILKIMREAGTTILTKQDLLDEDEDYIAEGIYSGTITWRVRKTPKGNVLNVSKVENELF